MKVFLILLTIFVSGCTQSGYYKESGPCKGFHKDPIACELAYENSLNIINVQLGQSKPLPIV